MAIATIQRWRASPDDPNGIHRLLNDFQSQVANAVALMPARIVREIPYTAPGRWMDATLLNSWAAYGSGYDAPGFCKLESGFVCLRGVGKNGTYGTSTIFTLPAGLRPAAPKILVAAQSNSTRRGAGEVRIATNGDVTAPSITNVQQGTSLYLSFDGLSFEPASPAPQPIASPVILTSLGLQTQATGVSVLGCRDLTDGVAAPLPAIAWEPTGTDGVRITQVFGLTPGHKYSLRFQITG